MKDCEKCKNYSDCKLKAKDVVYRCAFFSPKHSKEYEKGYLDGYAKAIDNFVATLVPRLTDAIYQKDVESMTNLINSVARELKAGVEDE